MYKHYIKYIFDINMFKLSIIIISILPMLLLNTCKNIGIYINVKIATIPYVD